jgi:hyperosmotically inducible periplasmic protein
MKIRNWAWLLAVCAMTAGCERNSGGTAENRYDAASGSSRGTNSAVQPDNTGRNTRDRSDGTLTPLDQGVSDADRETTRRIRRELVANDQLSVTAKNIKIITINGKVTLRGPVTTAQEKELIESIVKQAGVTSVDDRLEVKTTNQ